MDLQTAIYYWSRIKDNPARLLRLVYSPCIQGMLLHSFSETSRYQFINRLSPIKESAYNTLLSEIRNDQLFHDELKETFKCVRDAPLPHLQGWTELLYILVRLKKPKVVVETGVFDGISSSFILNALYKNNFGLLYSLDRPARKVIIGSTDLMPFETLPLHQDPGWLIPKRLKSRWRLLITNKKRGLKDLLKDVDKVDVFLHDSLHTKKHMLWEMKTVWPKIKKDGIMLIDDIFCNSAFKVFAKEVQRQSVYKFGLGAIRKC